MPALTGVGVFMCLFVMTCAHIPPPPEPTAVEVCVNGLTNMNMSQCHIHKLSLLDRNIVYTQAFFHATGLSEKVIDHLRELTLIVKADTDVSASVVHYMSQKRRLFNDIAATVKIVDEYCTMVLQWNNLFSRRQASALYPKDISIESAMNRLDAFEKVFIPGALKFLHGRETERLLRDSLGYLQKSNAEFMSQLPALEKWAVEPPS